VHGQASAHGQDKKRMALRTGGTRAQGHERWTSTENTTVCMQRQGTRGKEREAQDVGHGYEMERRGRRGVGGYHQENAVREGTGRPRQSEELAGCINTAHVHWAGGGGDKRSGQAAQH
jgi:hypothetical protein